METNIIYENNYEQILNAATLEYSDGTSIIAVKETVSGLLKRSLFKFVLYGSADSLEDTIDMGDYDIMVSQPINVFKYLVQGLLTVYPHLNICGKGALHAGTYRLRIDDRTVVDITLVDQDVLMVMWEQGIVIDNCLYGRLAHSSHKIAEMAKLILRPNICYTGFPSVRAHQTDKWDKAYKFITEVIENPIEITFPNKKCECKKTSLTIPNKSITWSGGIARTIYETLFGFNDCVTTVNNDSITFKNVCSGAPWIYFNTVTHTSMDVIYDRTFNELLPHAIYSDAWRILIYNVDMLVPSIVYFNTMIKGVPIKMVSPLFLLYEALTLQLIDSRISSVLEQDCSYEKHVKSIVNLLKYNGDMSMLIPVLPDEGTARTQIGSIPTTHFVDRSTAEMVHDIHRIAVHGYFHPSKKEENLSISPDTTAKLWSILKIIS